MSAMTVEYPVTTAGRMIARCEPVARHRLKFYGARDGSGGIRAVCEPCGWASTYEPGKTFAQLRRLTREHAGIPS